MTTPLAVQTFLRSFLTASDGLKALTDRYGIHVKDSEVNPSLVLLKYDQLASPMGERIVQECRGIILDLADDYRVVCRSFDKFFNHGEGHAAPIDWDNAFVMEKLDGSLMQMYFYAGEWHVASSGTPDASGPVGDSGFTFAQLFWETFYSLGYKLPTDELAKNRTYIFELMTKHNRIVVRHEKPRLVLLGVRDLGGDTEPSYECGPSAWARDFEVVRTFPLNSFANIEESFQTMNPVEQEGYVVASWATSGEGLNRVKVKHPGYVAIHHMKDGAGTKAFLEVVRSGETSELLTYYPEWTEEFTDIKERYEALVRELKGDFAASCLSAGVAFEMGEWVPDTTKRKAFALAAVKSRYSGALFALYSKKAASVEEYLRGVNIKNLLEVLNLKDATKEME